MIDDALSRVGEWPASFDCFAQLGSTPAGNVWGVIIGNGDGGAKTAAGRQTGGRSSREWGDHVGYEDSVIRLG